MLSRPLLTILSALLLLAWPVHGRNAGFHPQAPLQLPALSSPTVHGNSLVDLHRNITEIESITGNEASVGDWLHSFLQSLNLVSHQQCLPNPPNGKPRCNIFAHSPDHPNPPLLLSTHIDTVPPYIPYQLNRTFSSSPSEPQIWGRGSVDAKAPLAAQITAYLSLVHPPHPRIDPQSVGFLFVVGEETSGDGMRHANALGLTPGAIIFGEPTGGKLVAGHKGLTHVRIACKGKAAHSGYPWIGTSANSLLVRALGAVEDLAEGRHEGGLGLPRSAKYGNTTVNVGRIEGGVAGNVVPEAAHADLVVRIGARSPGEVRGRIEGAVRRATDAMVREKDCSVEMETLVDGYPPVDLDTDVDADLGALVTVNFGTDVPNWHGSGKRYLFGPGPFLTAHSDHEGLTVRELEEGEEGYERLILGVLESLSRD